MNEQLKGKNEKKESALHSIRFKIDLAVGICGALVMFFRLWLLTDSMNFVERDLMSDRLASDIRYLRHPSCTAKRSRGPSSIHSYAPTTMRN